VLLSDLRKKTKNQYIVFARHLIFWYLCKQGVFSVGKIASMYNQNHATVIHGRDQLKDDIRFFKPWQQDAFKKFVDGIEKIKKKKMLWQN